MSDEKVIEKKQTPWQLLRNKFPANEYVLISEVSDASGFSRTRSLDYMLINLWESRGLAVTGIEQKSWRNDWLKELKNPKKQENHFKYCDYFYLYTTEENVAKIEEIPITWGWYQIKGNRIMTMKQAPKLTSEPIGRSLMCAMLRRAAAKENYVHVDDIEDRISAEAERKKESVAYSIKQQIEDYKSLQERVKIFEDESGVKIGDRYSWSGDAKKSGQAVAWLKKNGVDYFEKRLIQLRDAAKKIEESLGVAIDELIKEPVIKNDDDYES